MKQSRVRIGVLLACVAVALFWAPVLAGEHPWDADNGGRSGDAQIVDPEPIEVQPPDDSSGVVPEVSVDGDTTSGISSDQSWLDSLLSELARTWYPVMTATRFYLR